MSSTDNNRSGALSRGIRVFSVEQCGPMWEAGLRRGDIVTGIDGKPVEHELDFAFLAATEKGIVRIVRRDRETCLSFVRDTGSPHGVLFVPKPLRRCRNSCIFCFIDQLPPGMRGRLYVKDEDYRHSFLNGNYITLCGITNDELRKISRLGLSPLYISVHALDGDVRKLMLGNRRAGELAGQLRYLARNGIFFHAQIVLCPGINDGMVLRRTVEGLCRFRRSLVSVAVVPVGLTRYYANGLQPVSRELAAETLNYLEEYGNKDIERAGFRRVFAADELYIRAGRTIPVGRYYGEYPQIENGVGLVRRLLNDWSLIRRRLKPVSAGRSRRMVTVLTSVDAAPYLERIALYANRCLKEAEMRVVPVINDFFGSTVTVAGLLTARDMIAAARRLKSDCVIVPDVVFNSHRHTLDGYSMERMERRLGVWVCSAANLGQLFDILENNSINQQKKIPINDRKR